MVSAIGIVPVPLDLFRWHGNVLSVFSALCVDLAVNVLDFSRIAVRLIATANQRIIGHVPFRIELLVQGLVLRRMAVNPGLTLSILGFDLHRQQATDAAPEEDFA
ncbi:hypothetical protein CQ10_17275 [Bradyrhizobium valentinum]|nr:hypothetical protein CQ10_17275 [Bradyrhizobium valentinum]